MKKLLVSMLLLASVLLPVHQVSAATATSAVKLITPNGGEKYSAGASIQLKWSSSFPADAYISGSLYKLRGSSWDPMEYDKHVETSYPLYIDGNTDRNSATWQIPFDVLPGNYAMELNLSHSEKFSNQYATVYSQKPFTISKSSSTGTIPKIDGINPNPAFPGSNVTVTGTTFKSNSKVFLSLENDQYGKFEVMVTKRGRNSLTFNIDQYFTAGNYSVRVENSSGSSEPVQLVVSAPTVNPFPFISSVSPSSGYGGAEITIRGGNFADKNDINYYSNDIIPYPMPVEEDESPATSDSDSDSDSDSESDSSYADDSKMMYPPSGGFIEGVESTDGTTLKFMMPEDASPGTYSISVTNENGYSDEGFFTLINKDPLAAHPSGTNVRGPDGAIYFVGYGTRSPYPTAASFLSYKFNTWESVVPASVGDMALPLTKYIPLGSSQEITYLVPPRNGTLVNDKGTVYIISGDQRIPFASSKVFLDAGYSFSNVIKADTSYMVTLTPINSNDSGHANGTIVNEKGTLALITYGYKIAFPNMATMESWGFSANEAVPANAADMKIINSSTIGKRPPGQLNLQ